MNTIVLQGKGHHDEGVADSAITPGMAVGLASDGKYDVSALTTQLKIAKEDALQGNTVSDAYAQNDILFFYNPLPGDIIAVLVKSGEDIDVAERLAVTTGGLFISTASGNLEALEDSGGALGANTLMRCRVLSTTMDTDTHAS